MTILERYNKERRRIQRLIKRYENQGLFVEFEIPKRPKRPTEASIRRLKKITYKKVREQTFGADVETGEKISYQTYKNRERVRRKQAKRARIDNKIEITRAPSIFDLAIERVIEIVSQYEDRMRDIFMARLEVARAAYGDKQVGKVLNKMIESGDILTPKEAYNYQAVVEMSNQLMRYLNFSDDEISQVNNYINEYNDSVEEYEGEFDDWY